MTQAESPAPQGSPKRLRPLWTGLALAALLGAGAFSLLALRSAAWQYWLVAVSCTLAAGLAIAAGQALQRSRQILAGALLILAAGIAFAGAELSLSGITTLLAACFVLISLLASWLAMPGRWLPWLSGLAIYLAVASLVNINESMTRLKVGQFNWLWLFLFGLAIASAAALAFVVLRTAGQNSIQVRVLTSALLLAATPIVVLWLVSATTGQQSAQMQTSEQLVSIATLKERLVLAWADELRLNLSVELNREGAGERIRSLLTEPAESRAYLAAYQEQQLRFQNTVELRGVFDLLMLADPAGKVIVASDPEMEARYLVSQPFFRAQDAQARLQFPYYSVALKKVVVYALQPVFDADQRLVGALIGQTDLESLSAVLGQPAGLGETEETYLVSSSNMLVTPVRSPAFIPGQAFLRSPDIDQALSARQNGGGAFENYAGQVVERAYRWLPQVGMLLITEQESAEAFREQARSSSIYAAAALLGIAVAFAGAYFLTHSISDPIRRLNQTVGQISAGNLGIQAQVPTQDEISGLARSFNQMAAQLQRMVGTLEMRVDERTRQLTRRNTQFETVAEVGGAIAAIRQIDALLTQVTRLISQRFGFYHVGIFLLDENGEYAVLRAANSEGGQRMLARSHRLKIGQVGIVGYVAGALQPRIALDVGQDAVFFNNPDLPQTRSEMALPLIAAGELLGVLDVQSTEANAFTQEDVQVLQLLANQVAVAIQNASLFSRAQEALETARRSYGEISQRAWLDLLNRQQITPLVRSRGRAQAGGSDSEHGAASVNGDGRRLAIPIRVRDLVIGTLEPYKPAGMGDWTAEELEALETVAGQLGVALDSARLYEETQIKAENERISGEIAARMRATLDIDSVLQTAVREMQHALKLAEVEIRLGTFTSPAPESRESHEG